MTTTSREKHSITNRYTGQIIAEGDYDSLAELVVAKVANRANLDGANLYRASLTGANLTGANLTGANLDGANLYGANLDGANLTGANLDGANLYRASLTGANLTGANLDGANLYRAILTGANLTGANLAGAKHGHYTFTGKFLQIIGVSEWSSPFFAYLTADHGLRIMHGCRHFSEAEAVEHWKGRANRTMTRFCLTTAQSWAKTLLADAK